MSNKVIPAILTLALSGASFLIANAQTEKCDQAADIVVQAREQARADISRAQAERIRSKLSTANSLCNSLGDAWYYRYLYSRLLDDKKDAEYALGKAQLFNSEGLRRNLDPFTPVVAAKEVRLSPVVREKWALVVGIGQYQFKGIRSLKYTAKDARDFADLLTDPNYGRFKPSNVTLLTDTQATTSRIKSEIERIRVSAQPEDLVVIYISTHGSPRDLSWKDVNYIVTYDTNPEHLWATSLPMVDVIKDAAQMIRAQRMAIFLDTCFSGAATQAGTFLGGATVLASTSQSGRTDGSKGIEFVGVSKDLLRQSSLELGRVIISASQPDESSWESAQLQNGIFTYYLIDALKQKNGKLPISEVFAYLRDQVSRQVLKEKKPSSQRPMMEPEDTKLDICIGVQPETSKPGKKIGDQMMYRQYPQLSALRVSYWLAAMTIVLLVAPVSAQQSDQEGAKMIFYNPSTGAASKPGLKPKSRSGRQPKDKPVKGTQPQPQDGKILVRRNADEPTKSAGLHYWFEMEGVGKVSEDRIFYTGDRIRLRIRSNADGYLSLWAYDPSGESKLLFPTAASSGGKELTFSEDINFVRANTEYSPGGAIVFSPPAEDERLLIFFSTSKDDVPSPQNNSLTAQQINKATQTEGSKALLFEVEKKDQTTFGSYIVNRQGGGIVKEIRLKHRPRKEDQ